MSLEQNPRRQNSLSQNQSPRPNPPAGQPQQRRQGNMSGNNQYWQQLERQQQQQQQRVPVYQPPVQRRKPWGLFIFLGVLCVALLCCGAFFLGRHTIGGTGDEMMGKTDSSTTIIPNQNKPVETAPVNQGPVAVTLKVWTPLADQDDTNSWLLRMQRKFEAAHPEYIITWDNGVCPESDAVTMVTADPSAAADVYMLANDQIHPLVQAGALAPLRGDYLDQVKTDVSATYLNSVTSTDGNVYGFPISPNTWFMYYNKAILSEEDVKSLEACLAKGKVAFEVRNAWYLPAFFFAAGGTLFGENGTDAAAGVQFGGNVGINATNTVLNLLENPNFIVDGDGYGNAGLKNGTVAAYFSGSWDYMGLYEALGENLGAAPLPTVMINGQPKQMKAYAGSKVIGVNPHAENVNAAMEFAAFLASADSQLLRFQLRNITPAASSLANHPDIRASIVAKAEADTMNYTSVVQPTIGQMNPVWGPMETYGKCLIDGSVNRYNVAEMVDLLYAQLNSHS